MLYIFYVLRNKIDRGRIKNQSVKKDSIKIKYTSTKNKYNLRRIVKLFLLLLITLFVTVVMSLLQAILA